MRYRIVFDRRGNDMISFRYRTVRFQNLLARSRRTCRAVASGMPAQQCARDEALTDSPVEFRDYCYHLHKSFVLDCQQTPPPNDSCIVAMRSISDSESNRDQPIRA